MQSLREKQQELIKDLEFTGEINSNSYYNMLEFIDQLIVWIETRQQLDQIHDLYLKNTGFMEMYDGKSDSGDAKWKSPRVNLLFSP